MEQPRVFEIAKELGMETIALMDKIREWKLPVKNHMASLDDALLAEIKNRLTAEKQDQPVSKSKTVKKTTKKAAGETVSVKKEKVEGPKKAVARTTKAATPKTATTKAVSAKTATTKKPASSVIRRKAGEAEAKAQAAIEQEILAQNQTAQELVEASEAGVPPVLTSDLATDGDRPQSVAATPVEEVKKPRGNIIGRMDLRRVVTPTSGAGGGAAGTGVGGPRPPRTMPRGIRTGFVAPLPINEPQVESEADRRVREEKEKKKKPGAGKENEQQVFTAAEFRKREVIFQPKKKKPITARDSKKTQITTPKASKRIVRVENTMTVNALASEINVKAPLLIKKLLNSGVTATINTDLDFDTISLIVPEFGWEAVNVHKTVDEMLKGMAFGSLEAEKVNRPPIVTVMGHVDHGKTTLLDSIRKTDVVSGEAGGITQHIGAYTVTLEDGHQVTFIDTPGHEAFTAMRARGANVTDIAIIVVAADDGLMPQTAEAINHAKAANVPIIVAVNKMDRPGANPDRIKQQLTEFELVPEEWGGTTIYCPVSALKREGIKELLEQVHLVAEMQQLAANPKRSATGIVIESKMEKGRGAVATLLLKDGSLKVGDYLTAGVVVGRVRSMMNAQGKNMNDVGPGFAVEVMGLEAPPQAGDRFDVVESEGLAREVSKKRMADKKVAEQPSAKMSIEELFAKVKNSELKELSLVLKTDVAGSLEAIKGMIDKTTTAEVKTKLVHTGIGGITESDVLLASTAKGLVIGFNVRPDGEATRIAKEKGVEIKSYSIIYELIDDLKKMMSGLLDPKFAEKQMGRAEVRNTFVVPKVGTIAGCFVVDGKISRANQLRLVRDGKIVYEGKVSSLKRFKDDVREVATGFECGIGIENFNDLKVGDVIEAFTVEQVAQSI